MTRRAEKLLAYFQDVQGECAPLPKPPLTPVDSMCAIAELERAAYIETPGEGSERMILLTPKGCTWTRP